MTQTEVQRLLSAMDGKQTLMARLIYGSGLWLMENGMAAVNRLVEQGVGWNKGLVGTRGWLEQGVATPCSENVVLRMR